MTMHHIPVPDGDLQIGYGGTPEAPTFTLEFYGAVPAEVYPEFIDAVSSMAGKADELKKLEDIKDDGELPEDFDLSSTREMIAGQIRAIVEAFEMAMPSEAHARLKEYIARDGTHVLPFNALLRTLNYVMREYGIGSDEADEDGGAADPGVTRPTLPTSV